MTDLRKAAEQALEALMQKGEHHPKVYQAAEALRQALAQPVDVVNISAERVDETAKGEHEWVGLTDEERRDIREWQEIQKKLGPVWAPMMLYLYLAIEAKLKEKNT